MEGNYYVYSQSSVWKGAESLVLLPPTSWFALWGHPKMHEQSWKEVVDKRHWLILKRSRGLCSFKWRCTDSSPSRFFLDRFPVFPTSTISLDMRVQCARVLWIRTQSLKDLQLHNWGAVHLAGSQPEHHSELCNEESRCLNTIHQEWHHGVMGMASHSTLHACLVFLSWGQWKESCALCWFKCEMLPIGSCVWKAGPQLVPVFGKVEDLIWSGALLEEVEH